MKILKTVVGGKIVQQYLYVNINVKEEDGYIVKQAKRRHRESYMRWVKDPTRALQALMGANFTPEGYWVTLTFKNETRPKNRREAARKFRRYCDKIRRECPELKYIKTMEHRHGAGNWHLHAVMEGAPAEVLRKCWEYYGGEKGCYALPLQLRWILPDPAAEIPGGLASYMVKELREKPGDRLFQGSNGLKKPEVTRQVVDDSYQLETPKGCEFCERSEPVYNCYGTSARQTYLLP